MEGEELTGERWLERVCGRRRDKVRGAEREERES